MQDSKLDPVRATVPFVLLWMISIVLDTTHFLAMSRMKSYPHSEAALTAFWWLPIVLMSIAPIYVTMKWTVPGRGGLAMKAGLTIALLTLAGVLAIAAIAISYFVSWVVLGAGI